MRLPILPIKEYGGIFAELIAHLAASAVETYPPSTIDEYFESVTKRLLETLNECLSKISPSGSVISFEKSVSISSLKMGTQSRPEISTTVRAETLISDA